MENLLQGIKEDDVAVSNITVNITLPDLLDVIEANNLRKPHLIESYRDFLADPVEWQLQRDYLIPVAYKKAAEEKGYKMRAVSAKKAVKLGAPASKAMSSNKKERIRYCVKK